MTFYSQLEQDRILDEEIFRGMRDGVFVDVGAHDGTTYSNTRFFEEQRGWTGVCIEPLPEAFERLRATRTCACVRACIGDHDGECEFLRVSSPRVNTEMLSGVVDRYDPRHRERVDAEVAHYGGSVEVLTLPMRRLKSVLREEGIRRVTLVSIDTEGSELEILRSFDPAAFGVRCLLVENNYADPQIEDTLKERGYRLFRTLHGYEQIYTAVDF